MDRCPACGYAPPPEFCLDCQQPLAPGERGVCVACREKRAYLVRKIVSAVPREGD